MSASDMVSGLIEVPRSEVNLLFECGYLLLEMNRFGESEEVFTGLRSLLPQSEVPLICLGNLQFAQGRYPRALKFHRDALKLNPQSALAQAHIGEALLFTNKRAEAKQALDQAISMNDESATQFAESLLDAMAAGVV